MEPVNSTQLIGIRPAATPARPFVAFAAAPAAAQSQPEPEGLAGYFRLLRRRPGLLLALGALGVTLGVAATMLLQPGYEARTALEIQVANGDFLNNKKVSPVSEDAAATAVLTDVLTQINVIQSEVLVDRVLDKMTAAGRVPARVLNQGGLLAEARARTRRQPLAAAEVDYRFRQRVRKSLNVRQVGPTRMVELLYTSTDPVFSADFVNTLAAEYIESSIEARWKMNERTGQWLGAQLTEMRGELKNSEDALQNYARRSGLLFASSPANHSEKSAVSEDKLLQVQAELSKAQADRASAQSRYEVAQSAPPAALADVANDGQLRALQEKLTDLRQKQAELTVTYTARNEVVGRVQAQIAPLEDALRTRRDAILSKIRNDYETSVRREVLVRSEFVGQSHIVTDQADKSIQYNILQRELESNRQLYESMLQQVKEAGVASAIRASNVRIVDPAKIPHLPSSPSLPLNAGLGGTLGLALGALITLGRASGNRAFQNPGDAHGWLQTPELGAVPNGDLDGLGRTSGVRQRMFPSAGKASGMDLVAWHSKPGAVAEAFRSIRTSLLIAGTNSTRQRVLVFTSASPKEGKTTIVSNLAVAMAEVRLKVLVIDADLRKPRMQEVFELTNDRGLGTLLSLPAFEPDTFNALVQPTAIPGLHVLPSGPATYESANLLNSPNLGELLQHAREMFDIVLIDTAPSLQTSDARIVGRVADGAVMVVRAGRTMPEAAQAIGQRFADDHTTVFGMILNDWNPDRSLSGYYGTPASAYFDRYSSAHDGLAGMGAK